MIETKKIGSAVVHPVGIGTWAMGGSRLADGTLFASYEHDEEEAAAIRYSLSRGQNHIDTAQIYGAGHCEEIVGEAINGVERSSYFLATKIWKSHAVSPLSVLKCVEERLEKLGVDQVDLIYTHAFWDGIPMKEYIQGLNDVVKEGLARSIGVSNFDLDQLREAVALSDRPIAANQILYNILIRDRAAPELLDYCREQNITIVAYRPVERHLLADQVEEPVVQRVAEESGHTAAQVAINWLVGQPGVVTIPKAVSRAHIDENLGAVDFELSPEHRKALDAIG